MPKPLTKAGLQEEKDIRLAMRLLKEDIEPKLIKDLELKKFIEIDTALQTDIFTEKLFRAPKLVAGDFALGAVLLESARGVKYLNGIVKTRYFATLDAIEEGKSAKSLIRTEDLPEVVKLCI